MLTKSKISQKIRMKYVLWSNVGPSLSGSRGHPYQNTPGYEDGVFQVALTQLFGTKGKVFKNWCKTKTVEPIIILT